MSILHRDRLLASPDRIGYGAGATGAGAVFTYPTNYTELSQAASAGGNYICLDNMPDVVMCPYPVYIASNTTIDGSARLVTFTPDYNAGFPANNFVMSAINGAATPNPDNIIIHCIKFDGQRVFPYDPNRVDGNVGAINIRATNVWIDHVEVTEFWDDAVLVGVAGDYVSISNLKTYSTDKAVAGFFPNLGDRHISLFNSDLSAGQRGIESPGTHVHQWNNYIHDFLYGAVIASMAGGNPNQARNISENQVYENNDSVGNFVETVINGGVLWSDGSTFVNSTQDPLVSGAPSPKPFTVPYSYPLKPVSDVKSYVLANAGATHTGPTGLLEIVTEEAETTVDAANNVGVYFSTDQSINGQTDDWDFSGTPELSVYVRTYRPWVNGYYWEWGQISASPLLNGSVSLTESNRLDLNEVPEGTPRLQGILRDATDSIVDVRHLEFTYTAETGDYQFKDTGTVSSTVNASGEISISNLLSGMTGEIEEVGNNEFLSSITGTVIAMDDSQMVTVLAGAGSKAPVPDELSPDWVVSGSNVIINTVLFLRVVGTTPVKSVKVNVPIPITSLPDESKQASSYAGAAVLGGDGKVKAAVEDQDQNGATIIKFDTV